MKEERVVDKPEEANGGEGTEVGEILRTVDLQRRYQAAAELLPYDGRVWNVVLAGCKEPERVNVTRFSAHFNAHFSNY